MLYQSNKLKRDQPQTIAKYSPKPVRAATTISAQTDEQDTKHRDSADTIGRQTCTNIEALKNSYSEL
jgi:hypothetical protein